MFHYKALPNILSQKPVRTCFVLVLIASGTCEYSKRSVLCVLSPFGSLIYHALFGTVLSLQIISIDSYSTRYPICLKPFVKKLAYRFQVEENSFVIVI